MTKRTELIERVYTNRAGEEVRAHFVRIYQSRRDGEGSDDYVERKATQEEIEALSTIAENPTVATPAEPDPEPVEDDDGDTGSDD